MSLLVHELLIGTGGGGSGGSNLQISPSNPVPLTSVTVTHSNSTVQVAHLQQRVVTITSTQSRINPSEKGSRLADALAGNPPYSYSVSSTQPFCRHSVASPLQAETSSSQSDHFKPFKYISRETYVLPFVLQDHNYGAPPPPTPPHSPPPPAASILSPIPYSYKVHQIIPPNTPILNSPILSSPTITSIPTPTASKTQVSYAKVTSEQPLFTLSTVGHVKISSFNNGEVGEATCPSTPSQIMATMPLHQQQFMPHPKTPLYSSPLIPPPSSIIEPLPLVTQPDSLLPSGGHDTDEESRLSDRSSSVGPSGEETETAPEGEGEEHVQADDSITRCICNFTHDDGYMIQCDRCFVWQHVDCMEIDRNNIPDEYLCEACKPRLTDKIKARALQVRRRQEIRAHLARVSSSDSEDNIAGPHRSKSSNNISQDRKVLKKKKPKSSKENKNSKKPTSSKNSVLTHNSTVKSASTSDGEKTVVKSRRRQSSVCGGNSGAGEDISSSTFTLEQLRSWIEDYEVAVTNHYSPELRAKVHAARINGISAEFKESTQGAMLGHRCRVAPCYDAGPDSFEDKILVAATRLNIGTAIIEYQGKYALKSQWNCVQIPPNLPYLPFVLQYNMQKEGLSVCVDARTYGNDARFARRSQNFNAEIRHVVERGSVHLYIVACKEIEEEEEIILPLDTTTMCLQPSKITQFAQTNNKSAGNENMKEEPSKISSTVSQIRKNGILQNKKSARKPLLSLSLPQPQSRTQSRREASSDGFTPDRDANSPAPVVSFPVKQRRSSGCALSRSPSKCSVKSPIKSPLKATLEDSSSGESPRQESPGSGDKIDAHKMTREERKIAAYMKAFERMEKAAQRRQEMEKRKGEEKGRRQEGHTEDEEEGSRNESADESSPKTSHLDGKKGNKPKILGSPHKIANEFSEEDNNGSSSENERLRVVEGSLQVCSSPPSSIGTSGFRFPKTKKSLMNEWLNETIDPVLHSSSLSGEATTGVPTCYMRSPSTPLRRGGAPVFPTGPTDVIEMVGRSAKKRWLRQAIIDETEPQGLVACSSPSSRPDSPTGGDYITPLKKRRLARESMSSEQSYTPPTTPVHPGVDEKYTEEEMEIGHVSDERCEQAEKSIKQMDQIELNDIIKSELDPKSDLESDFKEDLSDRLTIDIARISATIKTEPHTCYPSLTETKDHLATIVKVKEEFEETKPGVQVFADLKPKVEECIPKATVEKPHTRSSLPRRRKRLDTKSARDSKRKSSKKLMIVERKEGFDKNGNRKTPRKIQSKSDKKRASKKKTYKPLDVITKANLHDSKTHLENIKNENKESLAYHKVTSESATATASEAVEATEPCSIPSEIKNRDRVVDSNSETEQSTYTISVEEEASSPRIGGPKTPEGTPPETPVKTSLIPDSPHSFSGEPKETRSDLEISIGEQICQEDMPCFLPQLAHEDHCNPQSLVCHAEIDAPKEDFAKHDFDSSSTAQCSSYPSKPAAVKRKLSILEYRKRKSISCETDPKEDSAPSPSSHLLSVDVLCDTGNLLKAPSAPATEITDKYSDHGVSVWTLNLRKDMNPDLCSSPIPTSQDTFKGKTESVSLPQCSKEVKWNAAPTLLEQQRENLTARLRKEFGLCLHEDQNKLKKGFDRWNESESWFSYTGKKHGFGSGGLPVSSPFGVQIPPCPAALKLPPKVSAPLLDLQEQSTPAEITRSLGLEKDSKPSSSGIPVVGEDKTANPVSESNSRSDGDLDQIKVPSKPIKSSETCSSREKISTEVSPSDKNSSS